MLAYASDRRRLAQRQPAPQAMLFILAGHIAAIALVMSARMAMPDPQVPSRTVVRLIKFPEPPPPAPPSKPTSEQPQQPSQVDTPPVIVPVPTPTDEPLDTRPVPIPQPHGPAIGDVLTPVPQPGPAVVQRPAAVVRTGPRFATPEGALRPPYPSSKIASEEEATLRLRLAIDPRGRVIAVEPVGPADPAFLAAARRHLLAKWRYQPATEDGTPVASSTVISLRFQLD